MDQRKPIVSTPYDDVFRTLLNDCRSLIIPVLNEVFGEHYTGDEKVVFSPNEHFLNCQDGEEERRITDASFTVVGCKEKKYLLECQSTPDNSMLVRIFEYATQIALDQGEIVGSILEVTIPNSAILFLRSNGATPDRMQVKIKTPGGDVSFDVMVMKAQNYTLDAIFEKKLLFLIPFYIFSYENSFPEFNENWEKLAALKEEYAGIARKLDVLQEKGTLSAYAKKIITEMSEKVLVNIAQKYDNVREGVKEVMGGQVLEYEAKTIYNEGRIEGGWNMLFNLVKKNLLSLKDAAAQVGLSEEDFLKKMNEYKGS